MIAGGDEGDFHIPHIRISLNSSLDEVPWSSAPEPFSIFLDLGFRGVRLQNLSSFSWIEVPWSIAPELL